MLISLDAEKEFVKTQYPFMRKALSEFDIEGDNQYHQTIFDKHTHRIKLHGEKPEALPLCSRHRCPPSPLLFSVVL